MPNSCIIRNCDLQNKHLNNRSSFKFPKGQLLKEKWISAIPRDARRSITSTSRMCNLHFEKKWIKIHSNGKKLIRIQLSANAVPSLCFYIKKPSVTLRNDLANPFISNIADLKTTKNTLTLSKDTFISDHLDLETNIENIESLTIKNEMICRGCLCDDVELLESFLDKPSLLDMFVGCTFLQVEIGDGLPMNLCLTCISKCTTWQSFKQCCEQNDSLLRSKLTTNETVFTQISEIKHNIDTENTITIDTTLSTQIPTIQYKNVDTKILIIENKNLFEEEFNIKNEQSEIITTENCTNESTIPELLTNLNVTTTINKCNNCSKLYATPKALKHHMKNYHTDFEFGMTNETFVERPFECDICHKSYKTKSLLRTHIYATHGIKRFSCAICPEKFRIKNSLFLHTIKHTGERPFKCEICNKSFIMKHYLTGHMKCHSDKQYYLCAFCGQSFKKCSSYKEHLYKHTGERPFACSFCNKSYRNKAILTIHLRTHSGDQPFKCETCNKAYPTRCILKTHMKKHLNPEIDKKYKKRFQCSVCDELFLRRKELSLHLRTHADGKVFWCTVCDKVFKKNCDLLIHLRRHTGERPFPCNLCSEKFGTAKMLKNHNNKKHLNINN